MDSMKGKVNPVVATAIIVALVAIVGFSIWRGAEVSRAGDGEKPPGMPAEAAAEFSKRMGSANPTGARNADTSNPTSGGATAPGGMSAPGGMTAPGGK